MQFGKSFARLIRNFGSLDSGIQLLESGTQPQESGILLAIGIRNPSSIDKESGIQYLKSRIHSVESRIKDFLGLPYMGRDEQNTNHETRISPQMRLTELTLSQFILFYRIKVH